MWILSSVACEMNVLNICVERVSVLAEDAIKAALNDYKIKKEKIAASNWLFNPTSLFRPNHCDVLLFCN